MKWFLVVAVLVYLKSIPAQAQYYLGPESMGTGGAGRAAITPIEGAFLNPASIAQLNKYYIGLDGTIASNAQTGGDHIGGITVTDATPETLATASFSYLDRLRDIPPLGVTSSEQDFHLALAGMVFSGFSVGIAGHHLLQSLDPGERYVQNNMDAGALYAPIPQFGIGLVGYNLLKTDDSIPVGVRDEPSTAIGVNYLYNEFLRVRADIVRQEADNIDHKIAWMAGLESQITKGWAVRFGFQRDELADAKYYTGGFGWAGPRLSFDYAIAVEDGVKGQRHMFDLWAPF